MDAAYDFSEEKQSGMSEWEYNQKIKREQVQREEKLQQFDSMRNQ